MLFYKLFTSVFLTGILLKLCEAGIINYSTLTTSEKLIYVGFIGLVYTFIWTFKNDSKG